MNYARLKLTSSLIIATIKASLRNLVQYFIPAKIDLENADHSP